MVQARPAISVSVPALIAKRAETFVDLQHADLEPLLRRIGNAVWCCLAKPATGRRNYTASGRASPRGLIEDKGFNIVAAEADWPDAARIDHYVRHRVSPSEWTAFARFPTWMWRNQETRAFVDWLHRRNLPPLPYDERVAFYGLAIRLSLNPVTWFSVGLFARP